MYPLPFFVFFAPPFLAMGGPRRSSMLLALLMLVPGRLGGPVALPFETLRAIDGGWSVGCKIPSGYDPSPIIIGALVAETAL